MIGGLKGCAGGIAGMTSTAQRTATVCGSMNSGAALGARAFNEIEQLQKHRPPLQQALGEPSSPGSWSDVASAAGAAAGNW